MTIPEPGIASPSVAVSRLEGELGRLFRRARDVHREMAAAVHPELNASGYLTLTLLVDEGPQRATALAERAGLDKGSMSRQLSHLECLGLVARHPDPEDGRAQVVEATEAGAAGCTSARDARRQQLRGRIAGWDEARIGELAALLREFNAAMSAVLDT